MNKWPIRQLLKEDEFNSAVCFLFYFYFLLFKKLKFRTDGSRSRFKRISCCLHGRLQEGYLSNSKQIRNSLYIQSVCTTSQSRTVSFNLAPQTELEQRRDVSLNPTDSTSKSRKYLHRLNKIDFKKEYTILKRKKKKITST